MKYFKNRETGVVFGYDETYENDLPLIARAVESGWEDVSSSWPPAPEEPADEELKAVCKAQASALLYSTDWATLADVTTGSPKLTNQADFLAYRQTVRALVVDPVGSPVFPDVPKAVWE